jgi:hypothetical protein
VEEKKGEKELNFGLIGIDFLCIIRFTKPMMSYVCGCLYSIVLLFLSKQL